MAQPIIIEVKNETDETINDVEILHPSKQLDNNGVPEQGIKVQSLITGTTYNQILYELIAEKTQIGMIYIFDDENNPLKFLQLYSDNRYGVVCSRPLEIEDRTKQEQKAIGQIRGINFTADAHTGIRIPFVLPKQTLTFYFYPAPSPDIKEKEFQDFFKKTNFFTRALRKIKKTYNFLFKKAEKDETDSFVKRITPNHAHDDFAQ